MKHEIYTLGYQMRTIDEFVRLLREAEVDVLIDVREKAWSHKPGFSKTAFSESLGRAGIEYVHAPFAGNPKRIRDRASSHQACLAQYRKHLVRNPDILDAFDDLVSDYLQAGRRVCITCFERHPDDCHRSILASEWSSERPARVKHLHPAGCARLVPA